MAIAALGLPGRNKNVVLVGHSLGGLVAAYILEHKLCPSVHVMAVVAVSAPFAGSALLGWAHRALPSWLVAWVRTENVTDSWLTPDSPALEGLQRLMARDPTRYRFISGHL